MVKPRSVSKVAKSRACLAVLALATFMLTAVPAAAATLPQPVLGGWKLDQGAQGGFTLKKSGGKVVMTNYHVLAACGEGEVKATVLGSYPLKVFTRGGYSAWGIGKNVGGEAEPMAVKVKAGGKTYAGTFSAIWYYDDPAHRLLGSFVSFGDCSNETLGGRPK